MASKLTSRILGALPLKNTLSTGRVLAKCRISVQSSVEATGLFNNFIRYGSDLRELRIATPKKDMGTEGETSLDIDFMASKAGMFPDADTENLLFEGVRFAELPICHIKSTPNNTIIHFTDHRGELIAYRSCGMDGFKNTRKGTNIAAQTTAIAVSAIALKKGAKNVRVKIQGLGPGRMSSIKGLQMGGINIVSLTDSTPISFSPPRPKKARRL